MLQTEAVPQLQYFVMVVDALVVLVQTVQLVVSPLVQFLDAGHRQAADWDKVVMNRGGIFWDRVHWHTAVGFHLHIHMTPGIRCTCLAMSNRDIVIAHRQNHHHHHQAVYHLSLPFLSNFFGKP